MILSPEPVRRVPTRSRAVLVAAGAVLLVVLAGGGTPASATTPPPSDPPVTSRPPGLALQPTPTCPQEAVDEITRAIEFVRGQTWAHQPDDNALALLPDLEGCRVVLEVGDGQLSQEEEAALQAGAGSRLAIEYRRDWVRPSRLLLILWVVFGGSGVVWVYWRHARR